MSRYKQLLGEQHFEDKTDLHLSWLHILGGSNNLSLLNCPNFTLEHLILESPVGPPDPSGHNLLLDKSFGLVKNLLLIAGPQSEDLLSVYSDVPLVGQVVIDQIQANGRGLSSSSTSICLDGPFCPQTTISNTYITGARCGLQIAGGKNHLVQKTVRFFKCSTNWNVKEYYPEFNAPFGPFRIECPQKEVG